MLMLKQIVESRWFHNFVITVILINGAVLGIETAKGLSTTVMTALTWIDQLCLLIFVIEILMKLLVYRLSFFKQGWNVFDFTIVVASLIPLEGSETALLGRLLRIFRVLRLVAIIPELRVLLSAFLTAIPRMGYVSLLMFIIFYIYAAMGSIFFASINPELWQNISIAMLTLFRVATFEDWTDVMYETMEVYPLSWLFYLSFIFIVAFVFLNMMIGIVLETLQKEHEKLDRESGAGEAGEVHWIREHTEAMEERLERIEALLREKIRQ